MNSNLVAYVKVAKQVNVTIESIKFKTFEDGDILASVRYYVTLKNKPGLFVCRQPFELEISPGYKINFYMPLLKTWVKQGLIQDMTRQLIHDEQKNLKIKSIKNVKEMLDFFDKHERMLYQYIEYYIRLFRSPLFLQVYADMLNGFCERLCVTEYQPYTNSSTNYQSMETLDRRQQAFTLLKTNIISFFKTGKLVPQHYAYYEYFAGTHEFLIEHILFDQYRHMLGIHLVGKDEIEWGIPCTCDTDETVFLKTPCLVEYTSPLFKYYDLMLAPSAAIANLKQALKDWGYINPLATRDRVILYANEITIVAHAISKLALFQAITFYSFIELLNDEMYTYLKSNKFKKNSKLTDGELEVYEFIKNNIILYKEEKNPISSFYSFRLLNIIQPKYRVNYWLSIHNRLIRGLRGDYSLTSYLDLSEDFLSKGHEFISLPNKWNYYNKTIKR